MTGCKTSLYRLLHLHRHLHSFTPLLLSHSSTYVSNILPKPFLPPILPRPLPRPSTSQILAYILKIFFHVFKLSQCVFETLRICRSMIIGMTLCYQKRECLSSYTDAFEQNIDSTAARVEVLFEVLFLRRGASGVVVVIIGVPTAISSGALSVVVSVVVPGHGELALMPNREESCCAVASCAWLIFVDLAAPLRKVTMILFEVTISKYLASF